MHKLHLHKCLVISLTVRGLRETVKRRSIFTYLKDQEANFYFLQETFSKASDEAVWRNEWGGEIYFSHGTSHSKGVCILINRAVKEKVIFASSDADGSIILINLTYNGLKLSFCNIYAPSDHTQQVRFIQELNCLLIDKSEITTLIVRGDWNCTLSKQDKKGGSPLRPTAYRNLVNITMDTLDLVDIQRTRYPNVNKFSYRSKTLGVKSRIDFFLISKHLTKFVQKSGHPNLNSTRSQHDIINIVVAERESSRTGFLEI